MAGGTHSRGYTVVKAGRMPKERRSAGHQGIREGRTSSSKQLRIVAACLRIALARRALECGTIEY